MALAYYEFLSDIRGHHVYILISHLVSSCKAHVIMETDIVSHQLTEKAVHSLLLDSLLSGSPINSTLFSNFML